MPETITTKRPRQISALILKHFAYPYNDQSDPKPWREEMDILRRLLNGERLVVGRAYLPEEDTHGVFWYWETTEFERQPDGPVMRLLGRQIIRPVRCAGGYATMELTDKADEVFGEMKEMSR